MVKKLLIVLILLSSLTLNVSAGTLFIEAKKFDESQNRRFTEIYVDDFGYNSVGAFIVRFNTGQPEISFGQRSHWEKFYYTYVPDEDILIK